MKVPLPPGQYMKTIAINDDGLDIEFADKKKVALLFISINERYWPYLTQVMEDCKKNFLPHHNVDMFAWSDMPAEKCPLAKEVFATEPIEWPAPTLMRYHLFLQQEEKLKEYDYLFYLDADMRVVDKISDEILGDGLTVAEHPMYSLRPEYVPPYEPNKNSAAYVPRLGILIEEKGKPRFKPLYLAGGFQGGKAPLFIEAMKKMRDGIDKDFNANYTAIWNDESHWNKYIYENANPVDGHQTIVLSPSYIFPDSLVEEYYKPIWGKTYVPKIMTLTKPFSLTKEGGAHLNEFLGKAQPNVFTCPVCKDNFDTQGHKVIRVVNCPGSGKAHQLDMQKQ